jgi:hypothetical protein
MDELDAVLKNVKKGKAGGMDEIFPDCIIYGWEQLSKATLELFNKIIEEVRIPSDWTNAMVIPFYKNKGSPTDIKNYRPISLTSTFRRLFEKVLLKRCQKVNNMLLQEQAGFQKGRSTLDQCFILDKILKTGDKTAILLDLKAAYDLVNRKKLWAILKRDFNMDDHMIRLIQSLFDQNKSILTIKGNKGQPVLNKRGLLQGSCLSPLLFNCYINVLGKRLNEGPRIEFQGKKLNHLMFADDTVLFGTTKSDLEQLLMICEDWSKEYGMEFSPTKCITLNAGPDRELKMYDSNLRQEESAVYLGVVFSPTGINWKEHAARITTKARNAITILHQIGCSLWPILPATKIFKAFVRPIYEYGMAIETIPKKQCELIQKTQNTGLRMIMSLARNTSIHAMHIMTLIEMIETRNEILNFNFIAKLNNDKENEQNLAAQMLQVNVKKSKNPLLSEWTKKGKYEKLAPIEKKITKIASLKKLIENTNNVAGCVPLDEEGKYNAICLPFTMNRKHRIAIIKWIAGNVACHQKCKCGQNEVSRIHGMICSGGEEYLRQKYLIPEEPTDPSNIAITYLLQKYKTKPPNSELYKHLFEAISMFYIICLNYRIKENNFWEPTPDTSRPTVRALVQNPRITALRKQRALERNRPIGRPPKTKRQGVG